ncbi:MAG: transposase [Candidatus Bathyarchaeia archaeon]
MDGAGRPVVYDPEWDLRALMLRLLLQLRYVKDLVRLLRRSAYFREACGYRGRVSSEAHFSQMKKRIGMDGFKAVEGYLRGEANRLRAKYPLLALGLVQAACFDGTDLKAWSSRNPKDNTRGLGDPGARVGRGPEGFYLGYRSLPLGHVEDSANVNEKDLVEKVLEDALGGDFEVELVVGDSQLESKKVFRKVENRKIAHVIPWRKLKGRTNPPDVLTVKDKISVEGPEHLKVIYGRLRATAEGFVSTLKTQIGYDNYTWKGLDNATIHTCLAFSLIYAVTIAAIKMGKPEKARSITYFK